MKIFCVFAVGDGRLVAAASRAPDLLRRELATGSGCATLIWCSVPPSGTAAAVLVDKFNLELAVTLATASRTRQLLALTWIALLHPIVATFRPKQRLRRFIRRIWSSTSHQT
jgi:hypothetical protein